MTASSLDAEELAEFFRLERRLAEKSAEQRGITERERDRISSLCPEDYAAELYAQYGDAVLLQPHLWRDRKLHRGVVNVLLLRKEAKVVTVLGSDGKTALHHAASRCDLGTFEDLIQAYRDAAAKQDCYGWLPLHVAIQRGANAQVVSLLVQAHPTAVNTPTCWQPVYGRVYSKPENFFNPDRFLELVWEEVGSAKPESGTEIKSETLAAACSQQLRQNRTQRPRFSRSEWAGVKVSNVCPDNFVRVEVNAHMGSTMAQDCATQAVAECVYLKPKGLTPFELWAKTWSGITPRLDTVQLLISPEADREDIGRKLKERFIEAFDCFVQRLRDSICRSSQDNAYFSKEEQHDLKLETGWSEEKLQHRIEWFAQALAAWQAAKAAVAADGTISGSEMMSGTVLDVELAAELSSSMGVAVSTLGLAFELEITREKFVDACVCVALGGPILGPEMAGVDQGDRGRSRGRSHPAVPEGVPGGEQQS